MKATWADIEKAKELLGWQPKVPLEEGIRRTVEWHVENRELVKKISI
jgi:nucleoside-diphosphate-sugar epimerase